ncbi:MAG: hypothetical protein JRJ39_16090 [Deltaproteobacteria bacterium]|nr:hypothetical protein [Deltaproteobacteria bacterium]
MNLPSGDNRNVYGLDLGFLGSAIESKGIVLNLIGNFRSFSDSQDDSGTKGIQIAGLLNGGEVRGIQIAGFWNNGGEVRGIQVGAVNYSEKATGLQCGLYNGAKSVRVVQIGFINLTEELSGLQIGLINYIGESPVPILPIINLKF